MRLFVSVDLPPQLGQAIATLQSDIESASGIRLTDPEQAHITLQFLGDVRDEDVPEIEAALERAVESVSLDPFEATVAGVGVFPDIEYITVVWVGIGDGSDQLKTLQRAVEDALKPLGYEGDDHEFTPHVTIARMDHAGGKDAIQEFIQERDPTLGTMTVDSIALTESTLTETGPQYETRKRFRLA